MCEFSTKYGTRSHIHDDVCPMCCPIERMKNRRTKINFLNSPFVDRTTITDNTIANYRPSVRVCKQPPSREERHRRAGWCQHAQARDHNSARAPHHQKAFHARSQFRREDGTDERPPRRVGRPNGLLCD